MDSDAASTHTASASHRRRFVFEQLSDALLDAPYHFIDTSDLDEGDHAATTNATNDDADTAALTDDYLQTVYAQIEGWLAAVHQRWQNAPNPRIVADFQKNVRFLTRLLRHSRYPRLALVGRRGAGKSSVINALLGQLVAQPGHVKAQTGHAKMLKYRMEDGSGVDVLDTRGLNEGGRPEEADAQETAVDSIVDALRTCPVDAILFVHKIKEVDSGVESDMLALDEILAKSRLSDSGLPIIVVLTHADEMEPSDLKRPEDYDEEKLRHLDEAKQHFLKNVATLAPTVHKHIVGVEAVSCAVIWLPPDEHGEILPNPRRDYRYNVDGLLDLLLRNVQIQAVFRTVQACRTTRVKVDFADFLIRVFATIAAVLALTPIPTTDVIPLTALTTYMIYTIARLGNQPSTWETTARFLGVVGMTSMVGYGARYMLSQVMKFVPVPGIWAGSAVVSFTMTTAVGKSAVAFFVENKSDDEVRRVFDEFRQVSPDRAEEVERLLKEGEGVTVERGAPVDATHVVSGLTDSADKKEQ